VAAAADAIVCAIAWPIGDAGADADPRTRRTAFAGCGERNRARGLELRVARDVADHAHADALLETLLQLVGERQALDLHVGDLKTEPRGVGVRARAHRRTERGLIRREVEERRRAGAELGRERAHEERAQLPLEVADAVDVARARDFQVEAAGVDDAEAVDAERAHLHRAELAVADGDGLRRPKVCPRRWRVEKK
jgi:hypothetical protein